MDAIDSGRLPVSLEQDEQRPVTETPSRIGELAQPTPPAHDSMPTMLGSARANNWKGGAPKAHLLNGYIVGAQSNDVEDILADINAIDRGRPRGK